MEPVILVILVALAEYMLLGALVGRARAKYRIKAPATTGNAAFERIFRVHQNTLESLIIFIPAVWVFGAFLSPAWAAALGVVFIVARIEYARSYVADPDKRGLGAGISGLALIALVIGGLVGVVRPYF
jgi:glutathione S-transferase